MDIVSYEDVSGLSYDPHDEKYWNQQELDKELTRNFEICHGCRMCFKFCTSFPTLFNFIDDNHDGDVRKLTATETKQVIDECFQCKLCYINCPYTDQDNHHYNMNFPSLLQRAVHVNAKVNGVSFREKFLQDPDKAGRMNSGFLSFFVNLSFKLPPFRWLVHMVLGIHWRKLMPRFHFTTLAKWFKKRKAEKKDDEVVLFSTCFVNYNNPDVGKDTTYVLEKNNCSVLHPEQNCCGQPGLNSGDLEWAEKKIKANIESLYPLAKEGKKILGINPTCSMTIKKEYPLFMPPGEWREKAQVVANATRDVHEYLFELKKDDKLNRDFKSTPGKVAYHVPCHLRVQNIGFRSRDIMKLIPGAKVKPTIECCGHDGTWAMKKEYFDMSLKVGNNAFEGLKKSDADCMATDCPLAALQIKQGTGASDLPEHPVQIVAKAYKAPNEGGFAKATPEE